MRPAISINKIAKSLDGSEIFNNFSLDIGSGEITVIFGPNGSGKSTLLNILSGIISVDSGSIRIENPEKFQISYIFQNYRESLLPWRTNFENIAFPLEIQGIPKMEIVRRVKKLQSFFEFQFDWHTYPYQLSGGQQQILAFLRALITKPKILLIDEPFSALDYENNLLLRKHLQNYFLAYKPTVLLVTHNIEEAVHLAKTVIVFSHKPVRLLKVISNPLPYPRTLHSLTSEKFHTIKDRVLNAFIKSTSI